MSKYSENFKLEVVMEYLQGSLGYPSLAKKHGMPSHSPINGWVRAYQAYGEEGLRRKQAKQVFPVQFKLKRVKNN